jgi:hypothetical protein
VEKVAYRRHDAGVTLRVTALGALGLTVALAAVAVVLAPPQAWAAVFVSEVLAFAGSGALVAWRRPRLPAGWLLLAVGLLWTVVGALDAYVHRHPDPAPAWVLNWVWVPAFTALALFLLTFPTARVGPRRATCWRGPATSTRCWPRCPRTATVRPITPVPRDRDRGGDRHRGE